MMGVCASTMCVSYGRVHALDHVNLDMPLGGKVIGLFGPNGAGKSTFMRVLCGFDMRFSGTITAPDVSDVSFMPDRSYLYGFLTIRDAVKTFTSRYSDFDEAKAQEALSKLGLSLNATVGSLSKGMGEQTHLVLTFSRRCPLYVLDEPLAAVDPYTRDKILDILMEEVRRGATVLLSTHIISEVERIFTDVVMIDSGHIIASGDASSLRKRSGSLEQAFKDTMKEFNNA